MYDQTPFRYSGYLCKVDPHSMLVDRMPDNSFESNILMSSAKNEGDFRAGWERIRVEDKNAFHTYVTNRRRSFVVDNAIPRLGQKSLKRTSVFFSHNLRLDF
jgi:hypothetical protein